MHIPQQGEHYRHYKSTGWDDHTYEIKWIAKHSETEELLVTYIPLYRWAEQTRLGDAAMAARPLEMWSDMVMWEGKEVKRFTKIG
jgi:hypothetical protein